MKPPRILCARALDILSRQEVSHVGLKRRLAPYTENEEELEKVLDEFAERSRQSDQRYAEAYIRGRSSRYGTLRLKQALTQQGIDTNDCRELLPDREGELQITTSVLHKKFRQEAESLKEKQKRVHFLTYRGSGTDTIQMALETAWDEEGDFC